MIALSSAAADLLGLTFDEAQVEVVAGQAGLTSLIALIREERW